MKQKKEEPAGEKSAADSAPDVLAIIATDEFAGMGGSYTVDPVSGKRAKVEHKPTEKE